MWRGLDRSFARALEREGVQVQIGDASKTVLFRRKRDNADGGDWVDVYTRQEDGFRAGDLLAVGGDNYLLTLRDHRQNGVYNRFNAVRCNQTITLGKWVKATEPNEFGEFLDVFTPYATPPAYVVTELTGMGKTIAGNVLGGNWAVLMPTYPVDPNTPVVLKVFDNNANLVDWGLKIQAVDTSDTYTDADGNISGIMRLRLELTNFNEIEP